MSISLRAVKEEAVRAFPPGHPAREVILAQPDELPEQTFDALVPTLVALVRQRHGRS